MGFEAAATSPLDFNLAPYVDVAGSIADPSEPQVRAFFGALDRIREDARKTRDLLVGDEDQPDPDVLDKLEALSVELQERTLDVVAELCAGTPTRDQIAGLPYRVQVGFLEWLQGELRNPTTRPATKPPLQAVR